MPSQNVLTFSKMGLALIVLSKLLIRYMCALICGLSGKEYELITGSRASIILVGQSGTNWGYRPIPQIYEITPKTFRLRVI